MRKIFDAIADDLTGSVELAGMLAAGGAGVALVTQSGAVPGAAKRDAVVVALRSRVAPVADAVAAFKAVGPRLLQHGARQLCFKYCATFDSTPAGNIGPCTDALDQMTGETGALFSPTFPEPERIVYRGHYFVGDQLLSDWPKRTAPPACWIPRPCVSRANAKTHMGEAPSHAQLSHANLS